MADVDRSPGRLKRRRTASRPAPLLPDTPDPVDIAMEQVNAGGAGPAAALLRNQNILVQAQIEELRLKRVTRFLILSLVLGLLVTFAALIVKASQSTAMIVEPFEVPPALAQNGLTGEAAASRLLDRLSAMQKASTSARAATDYANAWSGDIKVVVPQTGASVGELWRLMRSWFGKETRITGEIVRTPAGLAVTIRAGSLAADRFEGPEAALDDLLQKAAESIFRATQPYRYGTYLVSVGRYAEDEQVMRALTADESPVERKWAYLGLSGSRLREGRIRDANLMLDRALAIDPRMTMALANKGANMIALGHDEEALRLFRATAASRARQPSDFDRRRSIDDRRFDTYNIASLLGDYDTVIRIMRPQSEILFPEERGRSGGSTLSNALALNHDSSGAVAAARQIVGKRSSASPEQAALVDAFLRMRPAVVLGDRGRVRATIPDVVRAYRRLIEAEVVRPDPPRAAGRKQGFLPEFSFAMAMAGDMEGAAGIAAQMPPDCYQCVRARGRIAALQGDTAAARNWFAEAIRQGPSLPFAYSDQGELLAAGGDLEGAITRFKEANSRGPRWADPLKYWGDALTRKGDHEAAARKYAAAAERAPRWGALHIEWGRALWHIGRHYDARAKFRAAARMDLAGADRARLERILAAVKGRP